MDGKRISAERHLTSLKTGLLLFMSLTPTITSAKLLRGVGPPEALSSIAVMFSVYCGPFRLGGGFLRSLMIPKFGSIKCHFILLCKQTNKIKWASHFSATALLVQFVFCLQSIGISHLRLHSPWTRVPSFGWYLEKGHHIKELILIDTSPFADYINMVLSYDFWHIGEAESVWIRQ